MVKRLSFLFSVLFLIMVCAKPARASEVLIFEVPFSFSFASEDDYDMLRMVTITSIVRFSAFSDDRSVLLEQVVPFLQNMYMDYFVTFGNNLNSGMQLSFLNATLQNGDLFTLLAQMREEAFDSDHVIRFIRITNFNLVERFINEIDLRIICDRNNIFFNDMVRDIRVVGAVH